MASQNGAAGSSISEINITPMIDVLLVLLVIFMIAQPLLQKSIDLQLPVEKESSSGSSALPRIVLEIDAEGNYFLNTRPVPRDQLKEHVYQVFHDRPDKIIFIKADGDLIYQDVIKAMDAIRGAGVEVIGTVLQQDVPRAAH